MTDKISENEASTTVVRLWEHDAPGAQGKEDKDIPTLTLYFADAGKATGASVVICPGGGYGGLAPHEGKEYALWLNDQGIAGLVLKYRLATSNYHYPFIQNDVERAMRCVRARADEWKLDPKRIGVMGSSAGGHLASWMLTHFSDGQKGAGDPIERQSSRPDLGILCYPVISMRSEIGHAGSRQNLIGKDPSPDLIDLLSSELQVTPQTPPCFVWHTYEDGGVKVANSIEFAYALGRAGVPFELHVYQKGAHGLGLGCHVYDPDKCLPWTGECSRWLREQGFGR